MHTKLGFLHPLALGLSHYIYGQPLDPMGIHFFHCIHGWERTVSHDAMWDAFAFIMKDVCFHVACEQTHIFFPPNIQSSCQWVNIVLLVDGIHMLANVIIVGSIRVDLVLHVVLFWEMAAMVAIWAKERFIKIELVSLSCH
jgi:hypothetical protein